MRRVCAAVLALAAGCGGPEPGERRFASNLGTYTVSLRTIPHPLPANEPFELVFRVAPDAPDLAVEVDARMPQHFHGMNRVPRVTRRPDGSFRAEGMLLHMSGRWELTIDISQGGRTERAQTDVDLP